MIVSPSIAASIAAWTVEYGAVLPLTLLTLNTVAWTAIAAQRATKVTIVFLIVLIALVNNIVIDNDYLDYLITRLQK
jgi:hypothetical protein